MKQKRVKIIISKLIKQLGTVEATAERLDVSVRWVKDLSAGKRKASSALAKLIQLELGE